MKHQPIDYDPHESDPDQAFADAVYERIGDVLFWIFVGAVIGSLLTCAAAYGLSFWL